MAPGDTRWGSQFDCLVSVLENRIVLDNAFAALRRAEDFDWRGKDYRWVLDNGWWRMLDGLRKAFEPLREFISTIQADGTLLCEAGQHVLFYVLRTRELLLTLAPADRAQIRQVVDARLKMFLKPVAMLAYLLHPEYRGRLLQAEQKREAIDFMPIALLTLGLPPVALNELMQFVSCSPPYISCPNIKPYHYWSVFAPDTPLSPLGSALCQLPCSQAGVERVFSSAVQ